MTRTGMQTFQADIMFSNIQVNNKHHCLSENSWWRGRLGEAGRVAYRFHEYSFLFLVETGIIFRFTAFLPFIFSSFEAYLLKYAYMYLYIFLSFLTVLLPGESCKFIEIFCTHYHKISYKCCSNADLLNLHK